MNRLICAILRRPQVFLATTALILTALYALPNLSLAKSKPPQVAKKVKLLPKSPIQSRQVGKKVQLLPKSPLRSRPISSKIQLLQQSRQKWIQIKLSKQRLIAWEGSKPVYSIIISTGKKSTPTRPGTFAVQYKAVTARMKGSDYDVPDVPYAMYYDNNYAIHGAYWHRRFGTPVSHGCTNLAVNHAKWLFKWASVGTPVIIN
ncbi:ErfK/YbiS/YcfS/YnhG family protein [Crinalium epipsammum PCC 9333]|uniref:ErfK/YbiS/YcfS/YnhG family protein n=1 Tax=Crinalium epipsammum PCC 9333 TaxID=1173022 RepID=K9VYV5_9CYAN|nr:L,D-transpeptidase [Crinalium epipsammum]AFZ12345.1 ErfK/YbiS/YcfS/YnhG family protein [Crinalium epipsammum PCC 9333]